MKQKKNLMPKIVAGIALFAILIWVVWTGALVVISSLSQNQGTQLSEAELQQYLESLSGVTVTQTGANDTQSWAENGEIIDQDFPLGDSQE